MFYVSYAESTPRARLAATRGFLAHAGVSWCAPPARKATNFVAMARARPAVSSTSSTSSASPLRMLVQDMRLLGFVMCSSCHHPLLQPPYPWCYEFSLHCLARGSSVPWCDFLRMFSIICCCLQTAPLACPCRAASASLAPRASSVQVAVQPTTRATPPTALTTWPPPFREPRARHR